MYHILNKLSSDRATKIFIYILTRSSNAEVSGENVQFYELKVWSKSINNNLLISTLKWMEKQWMNERKIYSLPMLIIFYKQYKYLETYQPSYQV